MGTHPIFQKSQQKPLSLVKALVALGGMEVKEEQITDILWPRRMAMGLIDLLRSPFTVSASWLAFMMSCNSRKDVLTLDPRYCWVDVWAFDDFLRRFEQGLQGEGKKSARRQPFPKSKGQSVFTKEPFCPENLGPWTNSVRERSAASSCAA